MKGTTTTTTQMRVQQCVDTIHRLVVVYMHNLVMRACTEDKRWRIPYGQSLDIATAVSIGPACIIKF